LTRTPLTPWDVEILIALDNAWMVDHAKRVKPKDKAKAKTK